LQISDQSLSNAFQVDMAIATQLDRRDDQSEGLSGLQVHYEIEFRRLLDGQITRN